MIKKVELHQTQDGSFHDSQAIAEEYVLDNVREILDKILTPALLDAYCSRAQVLAIIFAMTESHTKTKELIDKLNQAFEEYDEN